MNALVGALGVISTTLGQSLLLLLLFPGLIATHHGVWLLIQLLLLNCGLATLLLLLH